MYLIGYAPGVWDLLHVGHVNFLTQARNKCHRLIVGVPTDRVVEEDKGRPPIIPLKERVIMLSSLKMVDSVVAYSRLDFIRELNLIKPNRIFIGEQWGKEQRHKRAEAWCLHHHCQMVVVPYLESVSSTSIKQRCHEDLLHR